MFSRRANVKLRFPKDDPKSISRTKASFAKDADINNIMSRYQKTGVLVDPLRINPNRRPNFGDFSDICDLASMISRIRDVETSFRVLPASVREKFDNEPAKLLDFIADPANLKEAIELQLLPASMMPEPKEAAPEGTPTPPLAVS